MSEAPRPEADIDRFPTGIDGLDRILDGGLPRGGIVLIEGLPGTGKTVLANQVAFHHAHAGASVLYVTQLAESVADVVRHLRGFRFFDEHLVRARVLYLSGYRDLAEGRLTALLESLAGPLRERRPALLVLDSLRAGWTAGPADGAIGRFLRDLATLTRTLGTTTLVLAPLTSPTPLPEHVVADGLVTLTLTVADVRAMREVEVRKLRGSRYLTGRHALDITDRGLEVFPRLEAVQPAAPCEIGGTRARLAFDVPGLDRMLGGGLPAASTTGLLGPSGAGKTMLALKFLEAGARRGEPGLYFGFSETPARLVAKGEGAGMILGAAVADGTVRIIWQPPLEHLLDALAAQLLSAVRRDRPRRLIVDGTDGLRGSVTHAHRLSRFLAALTNELRALDVTCVFTEQAPLFTADIVAAFSCLSASMENVLLLRYVELRARLKRLISIVKVRDGGYDPALRELVVTDQGIDVTDSFADAEALLSGGGGAG